MAVFGSSEELYAIVVPFLKEVTTGPLRDKFAAVGSTVKVTYTDPDGVFWLDTTGDSPTVTTGADAPTAQADIEMTMSADDGHKLWLGELNVTKALAAKRIEVTGPMMKLLTLLPVFKPAFIEYRTGGRCTTPELRELFCDWPERTPPGDTDGSTANSSGSATGLRPARCGSAGAESADRPQRPRCSVHVLDP